MNSCTPCAKHDGGSDFVNERNPVTKHIRKKLPFRSYRPHPLSTLDVASSDIDGSVFSLTDTNSPRCFLESSRPPKLQLVPFREGSPKLRQPQLARTSIFPFLTSLRFPSIPRRLHIPLQPSGPEHLQVSDTTSSELDLSLCAFPFFGCSTQTSRGLTHFDQPPRDATAIETVWGSSHRSQARCCDAWSYFKNRHSSVLYPRRGWARGPFPYRCRTPTHSGPTACKA